MPQTSPLSLFDIAGKVAIVTGASGAFGAVAAQTLAGAGAKVALVAGSAKALAETAKACRDIGGEVEEINKRPSSGSRLRRHHRSDHRAFRSRRYPGRCLGEE